MGLSILHTENNTGDRDPTSLQSHWWGAGASQAEALELSPEVWKDTGGRKLSWPETGGGFVKSSELAPQPCRVAGHRCRAGEGQGQQDLGAT